LLAHFRIKVLQTGRSKHYAFIEFDSSSVAQIVAETMDNYLLLGHILKCKVIPKDEVHPELWVGANRKWRIVPHDRIVRLKHNKVLAFSCLRWGNYLSIKFIASNRRGDANIG
jgi:RNA recognition motif-containing protein